MIKKFITIFLLLSTIQASWAEEICGCSFDEFFKENYQNLLQSICPDEEQEKFYNILFEAYSIKFKGLDYEYENLGTKCLKSLSEIAIDEYDSFLDDLSFETCGEENLQNPHIKKHKRKYRKELKKLISKHCR